MRWLEEGVEDEAIRKLIISNNQNTQKVSKIKDIKKEDFDEEIDIEDNKGKLEEELDNEKDLEKEMVGKL